MIPSGKVDERPRRGVWAVVLQALPLAAILALAVELRLIFTVGMVQIDSLVYVHLARNLVDGLHTGAVLSSWATARIGLYGPVAILYALFGVSDVTTLAWPFACSLAGILCAYGVGRILDGEGAGLFAAFLWAVLPTHIASATSLLGDGPIAALSIAVVFFVLVAESARGTRRAWAIAASLACLVVGILNKPLMGLVVLFLAVYVVWTKRRNRLVLLGMAILMILAAGGFTFYFRNLLLEHAWAGRGPAIRDLARTSTDWWSQVVTGHPEFSWISPLWIVAASVLLTLRRQQAYIPMLWFASMFLYLELGSSNPFAYVPMLAPAAWATRHFLLVAAPAVIVTGMYLAMDLKPAPARVLTLLASAVTGVMAFAGTRHATHLAWGTTGEDVFDLPFAVKSAVATAFVIFGGLASPAFLAGALTRWKSAMLAVLLVAIGIATLNPSYRAASEHRGPWAVTTGEAARFLDKSPVLQIFVQDHVFGERLDYASGFRLGFNSLLREAGPQARIALAPKNPDLLRDAYILVDDFYLTPSAVLEWGDGPAYLRNPPVQWAEVARFGAYDGYRLSIYRVSDTLAARDLEAARTAMRTHRTPETLKQLMIGATGTGEYCLAAGAWLKLLATAPDRAGDRPPIALLQRCYEQRPTLAGPNLIVNGDFRQGADAWGQAPDANATRSVEPDAKGGLPAIHVTFRGGSWAVLTQDVTLQPDTAYVYRMRVRSTAPIASLYWQADIGHPYQENRVYADWTDLAVVFVTPHWAGQPTTATLSPILVQGPGEVWVSDVRLQPFKFDPESVDAQFLSGGR